MRDTPARCGCLPIFADAAAFAQRIAVEESSTSCAAALSIAILLTSSRSSSSSSSSCPSSQDDVWSSLLSALSLMPVHTRPSRDLIQLWQLALSSSSPLSPSSKNTAQTNVAELPAPASAMAVAAVALLLCSPRSELISSCLYSAAVAAAASGDNEVSRGLLIACGRLPGDLGGSLVSNAPRRFDCRASTV